MRLTLASLRKLADQYNIEIDKVNQAGCRYSVYQCGVPGATGYVCIDLIEVQEALQEILSVLA